MYITLNEVNIYYEQFGAGEQHVLLLHGWGCTTDHFNHIKEELAKTMHVTVIDFPAHGKSSEPPVAWGVPEFAQMTKQLIEALALPPVDIVAHSFGARVAIYLSATNPSLVNRLVLTGAAGIKKPVSKEQSKKSQAFQRKKLLLETAKKVPLLSGIADKLQASLRKKYGSADYNALSREMQKTFVKIVSQDLSEYLPCIPCSTLLVFGENDQDTPLWMGQKMEKEIPDAGLVIFENDDHFAYLRQWQRFTVIVTSFFQTSK